MPPDRKRFVTGGIQAAVEQARAVADGKDVLLAGGVGIAQQAGRYESGDRPRPRARRALADETPGVLEPAARDRMPER